MDVVLFSKDPLLCQGFRDLIGELSGGPWAARVAAPEEFGSVGAKGAVSVWDFVPDGAWPDIRKEHARLMFLVHRDDLVRFHEHGGVQVGAIVLKPIKREALQACLNLQGNSEELNRLRADRDEILQRLLQTSLRLQEHDQDRTTFLTRAVNEFRAPLTALSGYGDLLLGDLLGPLSEAQKEVLRRMNYCSRRLSRAISGMLQLAVGHQVKLRPALSKGDLRQCVEQALHEISPFADEKGIAVSIELARCEAPLYFDSEQIEQLLTNLLDNACKFTPKGGTIEVSGSPCFWDRRTPETTAPVPHERRRANSREPNAYRVAIRDSGPVVPSDRLDGIFEEYLTYSGASGRSGSGLGLPICRLVASLHEGRVWVENTESGPVFSFLLPFRSTASLGLQPELLGEISRAEAM